MASGQNYRHLRVPKHVTAEQLPNGSLFLSKPYDPGEVRHKIESLINSSDA